MATYAISDLHGCYDIYEQVNKFIKPGDIVYFLGDATDRGYDGWRLLTAIYDNPQWVYIKGNHEELAEDYIIGCLGIFRDKQGSCYTNIKDNSGEDTIAAIDVMNFDEMFLWMNRFLAMPLVQYHFRKDGKVVALCHSGFRPELTEYFRDYTFDRNQHLVPWDAANAFTEYGVTFPALDYIIHGHTHVDYIRKEAYGVTQYKDEGPYALHYCDGHKIDIDNGVFATGETVLLNLDTFEEHIFRDKIVYNQVKNFYSVNVMDN